MFIGQNKLLEELNKLSIDNMAPATLLVGPTGCGKHTYTNLIAKKLDILLKDITENINLDTILQTYREVEPRLYLIDINKCSIKEQNIILKFTEEPLNGSFIILLCTNTNIVLPTILSRCMIKTFSPYSYESLKEFAQLNNLKINNYAKTPGQLLNWQEEDLEKVKALAEKIVNKIDVASIPNTLSLSNQVAFKGEKNLVDAELLMNFISDTLKEFYIKTSSVNYLNAYKHLINFKVLQNTPNIDKKHIFERSLLQLKTDLKETL